MNHRTGDTVLIKSGTYSGKIGTVQRVDTVEPVSVAFVQISPGKSLTYRFDELDAHPSIDGVERALRKGRGP